MARREPSWLNDSDEMLEWCLGRARIRFFPAGSHAQMTPSLPPVQNVENLSRHAGFRWGTLDERRAH